MTIFDPAIYAPGWFDADMYYNNKLAQLGSGWGKAALDAALLASGYSSDSSGLYRHFVDYGNAEGLSPSPYFDTQQYLVNKTADFYGVSSPSALQIETVSALIANAGMSAWDHYISYGWKEGINPSNAFNTEQYLADKLLQLGDLWTMANLKDALANSNLNPISHFVFYGAEEGLHATPVVVDPTPNPDPVDPLTMESVLAIQIMDVASAQYANQPLTDSPFNGFNLVYKADGATESVNIPLLFRGEDASLYQGASATYATLATACEHALEDLPVAYKGLFSVSLGASFTSSIDEFSSSIGREIHIAADSGEIISAGFNTPAGGSASGGSIVNSRHIDNVVTLSTNFGNVPSLDFNVGDKINISKVLTGAISAAGSGTEFLQHNGISLLELNSPYTNHVFTKEEILNLVAGIDSVEADAQSLLVLRDERAHTFVQINNDASVGVGSEGVKILGSITTDNYWINADEFVASA